MGAFFGSAIDLYSPVLFAVSGRGSREVQVYSRPSDAFPWSILQTLTDPIKSYTTTAFGASIAVLPNLLVVGAPLADPLPPSSDRITPAPYACVQCGAIIVYSRAVPVPVIRDDDSSGANVAAPIPVPVPNKAPPKYLAAYVLAHTSKGGAQRYAALGASVSANDDGRVIIGGAPGPCVAAAIHATVAPPAANSWPPSDATTRRAPPPSLTTCHQDATEFGAGAMAVVFVHAKPTSVRGTPSGGSDAQSASEASGLGGDFNALALGDGFFADPDDDAAAHAGDITGAAADVEVQVKLAAKTNKWVVGDVLFPPEDENDKRSGTRTLHPPAFGASMSASGYLASNEIVMLAIGAPLNRYYYTPADDVLPHPVAPTRPVAPVRAAAGNGSAPGEASEAHTGHLGAPSDMSRGVRGGRVYIYTASSGARGNIVVDHVATIKSPSQLHAHSDAFGYDVDIEDGLEKGLPLSNTPLARIAVGVPDIPPCDRCASGGAVVVFDAMHVTEWYMNSVLRDYWDNSSRPDPSPAPHAPSPHSPAAPTAPAAPRRVSTAPLPPSGSGAPPATAARRSGASLADAADATTHPTNATNATDPAGPLSSRKPTPKAPHGSPVKPVAPVPSPIYPGSPSPAASPSSVPLPPSVPYVRPPVPVDESAGGRVFGAAVDIYHAPSLAPGAFILSVVTAPVAYATLPPPTVTPTPTPEDTPSATPTRVGGTPTPVGPEPNTSWATGRGASAHAADEWGDLARPVWDLEAPLPYIAPTASVFVSQPVAKIDWIYIGTFAATKPVRAVDHSDLGGHGGGIDEAPTAPKKRPVAPAPKAAAPVPADRRPDTKFPMVRMVAVPFGAASTDALGAVIIGAPFECGAPYAGGGLAGDCDGDSQSDSAVGNDVAATAGGGGGLITADGTTLAASGTRGGSAAEVGLTAPTPKRPAAPVAPVVMDVDCGGAAYIYSLPSKFFTANGSLRPVVRTDWHDEPIDHVKVLLATALTLLILAAGAAIIVGIVRLRFKPVPLAERDAVLLSRSTVGLAYEAYRWT